MNIYIYIYAYFGGGIGRISLKLKIVTYKEWWERVEGRQDFSIFEFLVLHSQKVNKKENKINPKVESK